MTVPSPEEQETINKLAAEVMTELRRVTAQNVRIEITQIVRNTVLLGIFLATFIWWIS